jgi:hypothetical protein
MGGRSRSAAQGHSNRKASGKAQKQASIANARQHISPASVVKAESTRRTNEEKNRKLQAVLDRKAELFQRNVGEKRLASVLNKKDKRRKKKQSAAAKPKVEHVHFLQLRFVQPKVQGRNLWVQNNRGQPNKPPLTRDMVRRHIKDDYSITLCVDDVGLLLHHLHYECVDPGAGYIDKKGKHPITQAHANKLLPFMEYLEDNPDMYSMFYYDETTPHVHERRDQSRKSGVGPGYMISAAVGVSSGGYLRDEKGSMSVGWCGACRKKEKKRRRKQT